MEIDREAPVQARAERLIDAPVDQAWSILTNLQQWSRWNPGVNRVVVGGPLEPGTEFSWRAGRISIASRLVEVEPERRIVWTGRSLGMDAVHVWGFEGRDQGTLAQTQESLRGPLARWFPDRLQQMLQRNLEESLRLLASECKRRRREGRGPGA